MMQKISLFVLCAAISFVFSCTSMDSAAGQNVLSLDEAIELSAVEIAEELPGGTRLVIAAFSAEYPNLSNYIMDELTGALVERGLALADRRNLE